MIQLVLIVIYIISFGSAIVEKEQNNHNSVYVLPKIGLGEFLINLLN
jgi:hypothetical protein